ncbi:MAG: hypothetical protein PHG54_11125 [Smithellaceae bacterium]|nr:hypothetical protein [Syntrophaceae bacterium]MDD4241971.1 hypothetical protein [Smithellaceae bacterium]NLX53246.1 hypothetical protein [Deltaproteobacteria bacterium]
MKEKKAARAEMEKLMAELAQTLWEQNAQTSAGPKKAENKMSKAKTTFQGSAEEAARLAQEVMYDAWETNSKSRRIKMAKRALSIDPDCADAWSLLADDAAKSLDQAIDYYEKGMNAGRRSLGEKKFKQYEGGFWGFLDTRPYMRARAGLMMCLWLAGNGDAAIGHAKDMLKLDPNDHQGIRYRLISYLAALGRYDELGTVMKGSFKNDGATEWLYARALLSFVKKGDTDASRRELQRALQVNKYVPAHLTGGKAVPQRLPDTITWGGEDEASCYASENIDAWKKVPGALDWLKTQSKRKNTPKGKSGGK